MEWSKIVIKGMHNVVEVNVSKNKGSNVIRGVSGLVFMPSGKVTYTLNGVDTVSDGTNLVYLPEGSKYSFMSDSDGVCPLINFYCDYDRCEMISFPVADIEIYKKKFKKLSEVYYSEEPSGSFHSSMAVFYDILATLDREGFNVRCGEYSRRAIKFMSEHISNAGLSGDDIASALNISTVYFRKLFIKELGMPPMTYLRKMRMNKAMELLKIPGKSVGEVAFEVGYSGIYPFSRVFKRENGISPSRYAATYKNAY